MCGECVDAFELNQNAVTRDSLGGAVATTFGSKEQMVLHAFKERGQTSLAGFLATPLAVILRQMAQNASHPLLVPIPSSLENYKKRGFMPTKVLAKQVCKASGQACRVADLLTFRRKVDDQAGLDSETRRTNLAGSMLADTWVAGRQVILFDDVVTTGSTILEAARAVTLAGGAVIGFLAFAETILKTHSES